MSQFDSIRLLNESNINLSSLIRLFVKFRLLFYFISYYYFQLKFEKL